MADLQTVEITGANIPAAERGGTILTASTAQEIAPANPNRHGFSFQNQSTVDMWLRFNGAATANQASVKVPSGAYYEMPMGGVQVAAISLICGTAGAAYFAQEW